MKEEIGMVVEQILGWKIGEKNSSPKIYRKNSRCICMTSPLSCEQLTANC